MKTIYRRTAAVLAFIIGAMAIFAGGQVLLGKIMDYYVIDWLPIYNFSIGLISSFITAILIWKGSKFALSAAIGTFEFTAPLCWFCKLPIEIWLPRTVSKR